MTNNYAVFVEGIESLQQFDRLKGSVQLAAVQSINRIAASGRTMAARRIGEQVKFPSRYLSPAARRLYVSQKAQRGKLEARITGRSRPTSLARFVIGNPRKGDGVRVEVTPGKARYMRRAFLVKLPAGSGPVDTKANKGLAVRLRPGERLSNKRTAKKLANGLYLLYGPSVDQVFIDNAGNGVAQDIQPDLADGLAEEFLRLMDL